MTPEERIAQLEAEVRSLRLIAEGQAAALKAANERLQQEGDAAAKLAAIRESARLKKQHQRALRPTGMGSASSARGVSTDLAPSEEASRDSDAVVSTGQSRDNAGTTPSPFPSSFPPSSTPSSPYPLSFPPSPETTLSESAADEGEKPSDLRALWNAEADPRLPRWRELTPKRSQQAAARLREHPLAEWRIILGRINGSPFCLGQNDRGWKADVEFFLRPDTATKVLEGKYDPKPGQAPPQRSLLPKADDPDWVTV